MTTRAIKIGLGSDDIERVFEVSSNDFIRDLARCFWNLQGDEPVQIESLFSSASEFQDAQFTRVYENFFEPINRLKNIYIEFGAPQYEGSISARTYLVIMGLIEFLKETYGQELSIILALPRRFPDTSPGGLYLLDYLTKEMKNTAVYIYKEHRLHCSTANQDSIDQILAQLKEANARLFLSPSERFGHKVVCHLGKFRAGVNGADVVYDFYDGSRASSEVYVVLRELLQVGIRASSSPEYLVVYDRTGYFEWFGDALENVEKNFLKVDGVKLSIVGVEDYISSGTDTLPDLIICPVVRTGKTLGALLDRIRAATSISRVPQIVCLIFAKGTDTNTRSIVDLPPDGSRPKIYLDAIVQRGARGAFLKKIWKDSSFPSQFPEDLKDYGSEFSSASMWGMLFETTLTAETSERERPKRSRFPDFGKLFQLNLPLFVHKIKAIEDGAGLAGRFRYLVPNEPVPLNIAQTLCNEHTSSSIVAVSGSMLQVAAGYGDGTWEEFFERIHSGVYSESLVAELGRLAERRQLLLSEVGPGGPPPAFCILDSCRVTGRTLRGLEAVAKMLGGSVAAAITLADFEFSNEFRQRPSCYRTLYTFGGRVDQIG